MGRNHDKLLIKVAIQNNYSHVDMAESEDIRN